MKAAFYKVIERRAAPCVSILIKIKEWFLLTSSFLPASMKCPPNPVTFVIEEIDEQGLNKI